MTNEQCDNVAEKAWSLAHEPDTDFEASVTLKDCAFTIKELQSRIAELEKDEARMDWMQENYICADFRYGEPATEVIVIEMPKRSRFCGDLRTDIDAAMQKD